MEREEEEEGWGRGGGGMTKELIAFHTRSGPKRREVDFGGPEKEVSNEDGYFLSRDEAKRRPPQPPFPSDVAVKLARKS